MALTNAAGPRHVTRTHYARTSTRLDPAPGATHEDSASRRRPFRTRDPKAGWVHKAPVVSLGDVKPTHW